MSSVEVVWRMVKVKISIHIRYVQTDLGLRGTKTLSREATVKTVLTPFSEGLYVQESKQEVTKVVSHVKNGRKCTKSPLDFTYLSGIFLQVTT